jgi:hypothetical protein
VLGQRDADVLADGGEQVQDVLPLADAGTVDEDAVRTQQLVVVLQRHRDHLHLVAGEHAPPVDPRAVALVVVADDLPGAEHGAAQAELHRLHVLLADQVVVEPDGAHQPIGAVRHDQPHRRRATVHHLLQYPQKVQQQLVAGCRRG